jgi:hypothetical protein
VTGNLLLRYNFQDARYVAESYEQNTVSMQPVSFSPFYSQFRWLDVILHSFSLCSVMTTETSR